MTALTLPANVKHIGLLTSILALLTLPQTAALALEACVRCDSPSAIYRCQVDQPGLPPNASISLICITELAKRNGHATCAVSRETGAACSGEIVFLDPTLGGPVPQAPPPEAIAAQPPPPNDLVGPPDDDRDEVLPGDAIDDPEGQPAEEEQSPKTVEELAKQTAKASEKTLKQAGGAVVDAAKKTGQTIEKTGDAIGDAAKKTWRCISSLFGNC